MFSFSVQSRMTSAAFSSYSLLASAWSRLRNSWVSLLGLQVDAQPLPESSLLLQLLYVKVQLSLVLLGQRTHPSLQKLLLLEEVVLRLPKGVLGGS